MRLKIVQILPELQEGGVERHVLSLSNALHRMGHAVTVISAGGPLVDLLDGPAHVKMHVHRKDPITGFACAVRVSRMAQREGFSVIHAHSRVPAWIAWWASAMSGLPWMATCHGFYSLNFGLVPYRRAGRLVCVSRAVEEFFRSVAPDVPRDVIYNGLEPIPFGWSGSEGEVRFLFVGRLSPLKGLGEVIMALGGLKDMPWRLYVAGDGPMRGEWEGLARQLGISERVQFLGFVSHPEELMAQASCLLFPSRQEGMGRVLMRAISMGMPVLASDIPAIRELLLGSASGLVPPGDADRWQEAIKRFISLGESPAFNVSLIPTVDQMAQEVEGAYLRLLGCSVDPPGVRCSN